MSSNLFKQHRVSTGSVNFESYQFDITKPGKDYQIKITKAGAENDSMPNSAVTPSPTFTLTGVSGDLTTIQQAVKMIDTLQLQISTHSDDFLSVSRPGHPEDERLLKKKGASTEEIRAIVKHFSYKDDNRPHRP